MKVDVTFSVTLYTSELSASVLEKVKAYDPDDLANAVIQYLYDTLWKAGATNVDVSNEESCDVDE